MCRRAGQADNQPLVCVIKWWFIKCEKALWPKANRCLSECWITLIFSSGNFHLLSLSRIKKGLILAGYCFTHTSTYTLLLCLHRNIHTYVFFSPLLTKWHFDRNLHILWRRFMAVTELPTLCVFVLKRSEGNLVVLMWQLLSFIYTSKREVVLDWVRANNRLYDISRY